MPRVSPEHLAARRRQILAAAARCFTRSGFHGTSMTDIQAEAGLSTGGVYRHFAAKDDIVVALATQVLAGMAERLRDTAAEAAPTVAGLIESMHAGVDPVLLVEIWAEASRNPRVDEIVRGHGDRVRETIRCSLGPDLVDGFVALSTGVFVSQTRFGVDASTGRLGWSVRALLS